MQLHQYNAAMSSIDEFEDLLVQMKEFSANIERKLIGKRAQLINEKQDHYIKINELRGQHQKLQASIGTLRDKETRTKDNVTYSIESLQSQKQKVDELLKKQHELVDQKNELQSQINDLNKSIAVSGQDLHRSQSSLEDQIRRNYPELLKYEAYLGLKIEAVNTDLIKFIFSNIDPQNTEREFWIELSIETNKYVVGDSSPSLGEDITTLLEDEYNNHQELVKFLKTTRNLFKDLV